MFDLKSNKIIYVITLFLIVVGIFSFANQQSSAELIELEDNKWEYKLGAASLSTIADDESSWQSYKLGNHLPEETEEFDYVWLRTKLAASDTKAPALHLKGVDTIYFPYQVYVGNELFFQNGNLSGELKIPEFGHKIIPLSQNYEEQYIYIKIYNQGQNLFVGSDLIEFRRSHHKGMKRLLFRNILRLIATVIYLLTGGFILALYFFKKDEDSLLYLGFFLISAFIFTLNYNVIPHLLFSGFSYQLYLLYYFNVFVIMAVFFLYLAELIWEKERLFRGISIFYFCGLITAIIAYLIEPHSVLLGSKIYNMLLLFVLLIAIYYVAKFSFREEKNEKRGHLREDRNQSEIRILGLGFIGLGINAGIALSYALATEYRWLNFLVPLLDKIPLTKNDFVLMGFFYFIVVLLYMTVKRFFAMQELALRDSLTGLYNHGYFKEVLKQEVRQAQRYDEDLSLLLLDLDDFKETNDTYGHQAGDKILRELAEVLQENVRESDIVARYGGEEFTVILINTDLEATVKKGKELKEVIADMNPSYKGTEIPITTSVGAASLSLVDSAKELINKADEELYAAKTSGKNRISY
ncbi:MAG: diguanylate cyclase [Halanaerobacter sp.]